MADIANSPCADFQTVVRNRTYEELARRLGPVSEIVAGIIERNGHASVLEIGAGFGIVMHQIHLMFGDKLEIYGLNRRFHHGNHDLSIDAGIEDGVFDERTREFYNQRKAPGYMCADAGKGIPLSDGTIDFVYSQATIPFVSDKANLIHEVNRVLKPGGSAHLQMNLKPGSIMGDTSSLFRIQKPGKVQSIEDYADEVDGLSARVSPAGVSYIKLEKRDRIPLRLSAVSFDLVGDPECPYVESTYRYDA